MRCPPKRWAYATPERALRVAGGVVLSGFLGVLRRVDLMSMCNVGVVAGLVMVALVVMVRGVPVVLGGLLVMLRGHAMMLCPFVTGHATPLS
jgi:hypothetical protein